MNKILIVLLVVLGFSISSSAQIKKATTTSAIKASKTDVLSTEMQAQKNVSDLAAFMKLTPQDSENFLGLFKTKIKMYTTAGNSVEQRSEVARIIAAKIAATIDGPSFEKLKANTALFKSLVN